MSARPEADEANYLERRTVRTVDARSMRTSRLFDALPPYLGGKRRLVPLILADLAAELPAAEWPGASFCDPMCGGGAVALAAKAQGFEVYASDRARRGAIVAAALIANSSVRLREADWLPALGPDDLRANGAAAVSVFTPAQARRIDGLLTAAAARQAPARALLELLAIKLVCRLFPMSLPQRHGRGARGGGGVRHDLPTPARPLPAPRSLDPTGGPAHPRDRDQRGRDRRPRARHPARRARGDRGQPAEVIYLDPLSCHIIRIALRGSRFVAPQRGAGSSTGSGRAGPTRRLSLPPGCLSYRRRRRPFFAGLEPGLLPEQHALAAVLPGRAHLGTDVLCGQRQMALHGRGHVAATELDAPSVAGLERGAVWLSGLMGTATSPDLHVLRLEFRERRHL